MSGLAEVVFRTQSQHMPPVALKAAQARAEITQGLVRDLRGAWNPNRPMRPDAWFATWGERVEQRIVEAQLDAAALGAVAVDAVLDAQGYDGETELEAAPEAIAGVAGDGLPVLGLVYAQALKVADTIDQGAEPWQVGQSWREAGQQLLLAAFTAVVDASRASKSAQMLARPGTGWVRMVRPPCCARCAILAGKKGQSPTVGFLRHPGCDCDAVPVADYQNRFSDPDLKGWVFDTREYFFELPEAEQNRIFTKAGAQAIRDGADPSQVVNARRGMTVAADRFGVKTVATTEGTTRRGHASAYLRQQYGAALAKRGGRVRVDRPRLMPEEIYRIADGDHDIALSLLHKNGYLRDAGPRLDGSQPWHFRDEEVLEATRRAEAKLSAKGGKAKTKAGAAGGAPEPKPVLAALAGGGGGKPPTKPPVKTAAAAGDDDGNDELMKQFIKDRENYDGHIPMEHIVTGGIKNQVIYGAHSYERRKWAVAQLGKLGSGALPPNGKTFFPEFSGGDVALRKWLGDENQGAVYEVLHNPLKVVLNGKWGRLVYGEQVTPDGKKIMLVVSIGNTKAHDERNFKVTSVYPEYGEGVYELLSGGSLVLKERKKEV